MVEMMPQNNVADVTTAENASKRAVAKQQVAQNFADRRKQQQENRSKNGGNGMTKQESSVSAASSSTSSLSSSSQPKTQKHQQIVLPSLCFVLRQAWGDVMGKLEQQRLENSVKPHSNAHNKKSADKKAQQLEKKMFPSVLSVLQATAVKQQVDLLEEKDLIDTLLPSHYDFSQAITNMCQSRSRAFLLLDLATIVKTHVYWKNQVKQQKSQLQFTYTVQRNANPKLLQVMQRLNVGCKVSTKYELELFQKNADKINKDRETNKTFPIHDDASILSKPNSFYRALVFDQGVSTIAVDDAHEIVRIMALLKRQLKREGKRDPSVMENPLDLKFILRLDKLDATVIQQTVKAVQSKKSSGTDKCTLVGLSLELPLIAMQNDNDEDKDRKQENENNAHKLTEWIQSVQKLLDYMQDTLKYPCEKLDFTTPRSVPQRGIPKQLLEWCAQLKQKVTLDVSYLLVANAGALCTRVIGVKQSSPNAIHYYIDDGCYGSLYASTQRTPIPLIHRQLSGESNSSNDGAAGATTTTATSSATLTTLSATVWGPTCDGLDKVCQDTPLPKLDRDDWLVFPNLGFVHVGTAFNGFTPPDTAYCVLGYFNKKTGTPTTAATATSSK